MASEAAWPAEFSDFKRLDAVLKCGICYDYMTNCMITSCSHTYCSLCIRKFMQYKNQCPACFEETYEIHLRNNRPLDEVISIFVKTKDKLQRALRLATIPISAKESQSESNVEADSTPKTPKNKTTFEPKTPSSVRSKTPASATKLFGNQTSSPQGSRDKPAKAPSVPQSGEDVVLNGVKIPGIFNAPVTFPKARKPDEMAECPVCHVEVPARNINIHLDSCLAVESEVCQRKAKAPPKRDPLPKRLYDLMQDKALKKVLKDYGLSTQGDRKTLIGRIKRYTVIYNSENDSPNPRPVSELVAQLEREEREEKRPSNALMKSFARQNQQQRITVDRKADPEVIEQANKAYRDENKDHFKKLIEQMRAREGKYIKPLKPPPRVYSDDEDDPNHVVSFDPAVPSTSREDPSTLCSVTTRSNSYDSDSDIFQDSEEKQSGKGQIDWNRTGLSEKDTFVISDNESEVDNVDLLAVGSEDETRSKSRDRFGGNEGIPLSRRLSEEPAGSDELDSDHESAAAEFFKAEESTGGKQLPSKVTSQNPHPLSSEPSSPGADKVSDERGCLSNSAEKENVDAGSARPEKSPSSNPSKPALHDSQGLSESDGILDVRVDSARSSAATRSSRRSVQKPGSTAPSSTSSRGTKRKSGGGSPGTRMVDTFDYLFEKYNGDRVNEDIESDDASSGLNPPDLQPVAETRTTRRSARNAKPSVPQDCEDSNAKTTRKRAKKDLSPAF